MYPSKMRPLHIRLLAAQRDRDNAEAVVAPLRGAGHLVTTSADQTVPDDLPALPDYVIVEGSANGTPESLDGAEARHIAAVLRYAGGNRRRAALLLGIARSTLLAKIRRYGL
jgi:DNA-binding NtrC family response regulator